MSHFEGQMSHVEGHRSHFEGQMSHLGVSKRFGEGWGFAVLIRRPAFSGKSEFGSRWLYFFFSN
jgi:hypothetical protein